MHKYASKTKICFLDIQKNKYFTIGEEKSQLKNKRIYSVLP